MLPEVYVNNERLPPDQVIPFLRSKSIAETSVGEAKHLCLQVDVLCQLFRVLVSYGTGEFPLGNDCYPTVEFKKISGDDSGQGEGDLVGFKQLKDQLKRDIQSLSEHDMTSGSGGEPALRFRAKLLVGIESNTRSLIRAISLSDEPVQPEEDMEVGKIQAMKNKAIRATNLLAHLRSRNQSFPLVESAVRLLYKEAFSILLDRLYEAGYKDSHKSVKWNDNGPPNADSDSKPE